MAKMVKEVEMVVLVDQVLPFNSNCLIMVVSVVRWALLVELVEWGHLDILEMMGIKDQMVRQVEEGIQATQAL